MNTTITARHCEISDELRTRAEEVLGRLGSLTDRPVDGTVVFDVAPNLWQVEIRLHISRGDIFVGTGEEKDHRTALDRAEEKSAASSTSSSPAEEGAAPLKDAV
jgi:ribosome-associated translation inhibitor RaiA